MSFIYVCSFLLKYLERLRDFINYGGYTYARFDGQLFVTHSFMNSTDVQKFKQIIEKWSF